MTEKKTIDFVKSAMKHYGEEVMLNRALPRIEDGLKPIQRLLFWSAMDVCRDKFVKSAKISGHCIASYSPHGEAAAYNSMVKMVNDRYPLIEGQGNFGGATTEAASARYTEARIHPFAKVLSSDLPDWKSIPYEKNYDDTKDQPEYLPTSLPLLLLNSNTGISVAITSKFPGFNAEEVASAVNIWFKTKNKKKAAAAILGPDPGGCKILSTKEEIETLLSTGEGSIVYECAHTLSSKGKNPSLIITGYAPEFSVTGFLKKCADLQDTGEVIATRNETSAKNGDRIVVEYADAAALAKVKKLLTKKITYKMTCLVKKNGELKPVVLGVADILEIWCQHRLAVISSTMKEMAKEKERHLKIENAKIKVISDLKTLLKLIQEDGADAKIQAHFRLDDEEFSSIMNMKIDSLKKASLDDLKSKVAKLKSEIEAIKHDAENPEKIAIKNANAASDWLKNNLSASYSRSSSL